MTTKNTTTRLASERPPTAPMDAPQAVPANTPAPAVTGAYSFSTQGD